MEIRKTIGYVALSSFLAFAGCSQDIADTKPCLPNNFQNLSPVYSPLKSVDEKKLREEKGIIGKTIDAITLEKRIEGEWKGIEEQVRVSDARNIEDEDCSIALYSDGRFERANYGNVEKGFYKIKDSRIYFSQQKEFEIDSNLNHAFIRFDNKRLVLVFPKMPKTIVYKKIESN